MFIDLQLFAASGGVISSSNFGPLLEPNLRELFFESYTELAEQFPQVYHMKTSKKATETDRRITGLGLWDEVDSMEGPNYETIELGEEIAYTHKVWMKGFQIERELVDDEQYDVINDLPRNLARTGRATVETFAAKTLNDAFTTTLYDGVSLCSDAHPIQKGSSATISNLLTGALDNTNLESLLTLGRAQVDDAGIKIQTHFTDLILPPALEFTGLRILNSALAPGTGNNDTNVLKSRLNPIVLDYLTSATAYFIMDRNLHGMKWYWRVRPEFTREPYGETRIQRYWGYYRAARGVSDFRGLAGSTGAG